MRFVRKREKRIVNGFPMILGYLGLFLMLESFIVLAPLAILIFYPSEAGCWRDFVYPACIGFVLGMSLFLIFLFGRQPGKFYKNQESVLLVSLWLSAVALSALPFYLSTLYGELDMSYTEAFFEAMSGYSTTGLTVFAGFLDSTFEYAHVFLFHRAMMQFIGGVGLVLVVTSVIHDKNNTKLFNAEGHNDRLLPNIGKTARWIFFIYTLYIALGAIALWVIGMDPFEALCHSISCLATGGFSTRSSGLLYWQVGPAALSHGRQIAMEIVFEILMFLGSSSFVIHFLFFMVFTKPFEAGEIKKRFFAVFRDFELRFSLIIIVLVTFVSTIGTLVHVNLNSGDYVAYLNTTAEGKLTILESFRYNLFYAVCALSTTGYSNAGPLSPIFGSLTALGDLAVMLSIFIMSIGGATGSTAGGVKQWRFGIAVKDFAWSMKQKFSNDRTVSAHPITRHGEIIEVKASDKSEAYNYCLLYLVTLILGSLILVALPYTDFRSSLYNYSSALSTLGLTVFEFNVHTTPIHSFLDYKNALITYKESLTPYNIMLVDCIIGMMFARLEIMICIYAARGFFYDPFVRFVQEGKYRGTIYSLKRARTLSISRGNLVKAEAINEVLREYEKLSKAIIETKGNHAKLNRQDVLGIIEKKRNEFINISDSMENPNNKAKYALMASEIDQFLPRGRRAKI